MLWRNGCDGKALHCGAGKRHRHSCGIAITVLTRVPVSCMILYCMLFQYDTRYIVPGSGSGLIGPALVRYCSSRIIP
jgi:hypothetical protein